MESNGFLLGALAIAATGMGLYWLGPSLERWDAHLKAEIKRLRGDNTQSL